MTQPEPKALVSVIVTTRNSARFLDACLKSIVGQSYSPIELVVVDNHSSDATREIATRYTDHIYTAGPERSSQFNQGARHASGDYLYKVDSDFALEADVVEACIAEIGRGFDAVVVHNSPDISVGWIARVRKFEVDMYKYDLTHSSARFLRASVFWKVGGFDETITAGEDYDFQNRLNRAGFETGFVRPEALHLGEPRSFAKHMLKYFQYGRDFVVYQSLNRHESKRQLRFFRSIYWQHRNEFARHPIRGSMFIAYHCCKYVFGGLGFLVGKMRPVAYR